VYNSPSVTTSSVNSDPDNSIRVIWMEPENGGGAETIDGYRITWDPPDNGGTIDVGSEQNEEIIDLLKSNTNYNFEVAVKTSTGILGEISTTAEEATSEQMSFCETCSYIILSINGNCLNTN